MTQGSHYGQREIRGCHDVGASEYLNKLRDCVDMLWRVSPNVEISRQRCSRPLCWHEDAIPSEREALIFLSEHPSPPHTLLLQFVGAFTSNPCFRFSKAA
eukprot:CAMPEP_0113685964 /NCGR_PEP_ID=MMETSP0038_2-20120614/14998_1 /TAXON_ID=2898 /ORGANISM="Cryptomonas paramecium" /LENGTH=99 /DNA_ID=CAMNT_0000606177 /DNA_START=823 /DNA_END=1122 /DNA_ORIENTATION=- /assembly_acc=CAM_ASM_000170